MKDPIIHGCFPIEQILTPFLNFRIALISEFSHLPPGASLQSNRYKKRQKKGGDQAAVAICDLAFTPHDIYKLWNDSRTNAGAQEDAEEFLGFVLNRINDEMLEVSVYRSERSERS